MSNISHFDFVIALEKLGWKFKGINDEGEKIYQQDKGIPRKTYCLCLSDTQTGFLWRKSLGITNIKMIKDYGYGDSGLPESISYVYAKKIMEEIEFLEDELLKANIPFSENYFNSRNDKLVINDQIRQKFNLSELECDLKKDLEEKE